MTRRHARVRAFSLLEMLVATALGAVLAASLYASLGIAFKARRSALGAVEPVRKADIAMELLGEDIRSAVVPNGILAGPFVGEDGTDTQGRDSDSIVFYGSAASPELAEGIGDIKKIELGCVPADDGRGQVLVRLITTNLRAPRTVEPVQEILCRGVYSLNLRYYDGSIWSEYWDSTTADNALPCVIEVTLQLISDRPTDANGDGGYRTSQVFLVPCSVPLSGDMQVTGSSS